MKFNCGETYKEEKERLSKWHPFYPYWPRRVGYKDCRAFEWIERRKVYYTSPVIWPGCFDDGWWEYRERKV